LKELQILGPLERMLVTQGFNRPFDRTPAPETCIHALFEKQVQEKPEACAIVCGKEQLSYRELNLRANHLGAILQKHGIGPNVPVAIRFARSPEMLIGILGILKAGGAYVPLDPSYPQERLQFILEDTQAPVLLTSRELEPLPFERKT